MAVRYECAHFFVGNRSTFKDKKATGRTIIIL
jgi:hypothetical protein